MFCQRNHIGYISYFPGYLYLKVSICFFHYSFSLSICFAAHLSAYLTHHYLSVFLLSLLYYFQTTISLLQFAFWHVCSLSLYCSERQAVSVSHMCLLLCHDADSNSHHIPHKMKTYTLLEIYTCTMTMCTHGECGDTRRAKCSVSCFPDFFFKPEGHLE